MLKYKICWNRAGKINMKINSSIKYEVKLFLKKLVHFICIYLLGYLYILLLLFPNNFSPELYLESYTFSSDYYYRSGQVQTSQPQAHNKNKIIHSNQTIMLLFKIEWSNKIKNPSSQHTFFLLQKSSESYKKMFAWFA